MSLAEIYLFVDNSLATCFGTQSGMTAISSLRVSTSRSQWLVALKISVKNLFDSNINNYKMKIHLKLKQGSWNVKKPSDLQHYYGIQATC